MRKLMIAGVFLCLSATLALAQGKVENGWACEKASDTHSIAVGDQENHSYTIAQFKCTSTKGEIEGVKEKEGTGTEFAEVMGSDSSGHGIFVETMANGDMIHFKYETKATWKDGQMESGSNKWWATGGTGKFKGIKGHGTCSGKGNPDGSSSFTCSGTYTMPK
jgi:hypothetical protein